MPKITVLPHEQLCPEGKVFAVETGATLCREMLARGVEIEHACELSCACTTCHVIVREGLASLPEADEAEEDMLDRAWGLTSQSRLSCQLKVGTQDLVIEIPKYTLNYAREEH
ncbi:MAG: ISC system 2Fe-2S type ferredoxin [Burkholderiaceae bacterium]|nr:ISC system 2Fe-2S type ferredoxin [Burkholderiaceae bacterium]